MSFFNRFRKKEPDLSDEEKEQLDSLVEQRNEPNHSYETTFEDIINYVASLKTTQEVNRIRNLLDAREREIESDQTNSTLPSKYESSQKQEELPSVDIEEVDSYKSIDETPKPSQKSPLVEEISSKESSENIEKKATPVLEELQKIFGEDSIFHTTQNKSFLDILKDKNVFHIGIRNKDGFSSLSLTEQNSWFVSNIKKLSNLREFKMIRSEEGIKDLVWDRGDSAVVISFRVTSLLEDEESFDFSL